jgi:hypothetical protein
MSSDTLGLAGANHPDSAYRKAIAMDDDHHPHRNGDRPPAGDGQLPAELLRLRDRWSGLYSITCQDGTWSAYYLRTAEEFDAKSPRGLDAKIRRDYARRLEIRPGAPERMST